MPPPFRRIDTSAAEFPSKTPYLYSGWDEAPLPEADEASPSDRRKVIILGGGPNRIGQGIEFDHCCVHAVQALREAGCETIMINCNPETVSTDYSTADRLYFEPLTAEHVLAVAGREAEKGEVLGVLVQFGGQTPLGLARQLEAEGLPVLGTPVSAIDLAEDRDRFRALLDELGLKQPAARIARSREEAAAAAEELGYPVLLRPSYVLGGRAMRRVESREELEAWIGSAVAVSGDHPVLIDSYLAQATEADVDGLADGANAVVAGVMEHVEEAGIHSGDSACSLPADSLAPGVEDEIRRQGALLGSALGVVGLFNIQFAVHQGEVYVLEANPRASRTVPFLSKATGLPLARHAARLALGAKLADLGLPEEIPIPFAAVKESIFPFDRFPGADAKLGPEMRSTGEVMGIDTDFPRAFWKAQIALGLDLPAEGRVFLSVRREDRAEALELARGFARLGFSLMGTLGTAAALREAGLEVEAVPKVHEGGRPHVIDRMISGDVALVVNTPLRAAHPPRQRLDPHARLRARHPLLHHPAGRARLGAGLGGGTRAPPCSPLPAGLFFPLRRARSARLMLQAWSAHEKMQRVPLSKEGYQALRDELHGLKTRTRPELVEAIKTARAHGDLSENAEYHAAREKQSFVEGRISELESLLGRAEIIDPAAQKGDTVKFGGRGAGRGRGDGGGVGLAHRRRPRAKRKIGVASPMARALIGRKAGDSVEVATPKGARAYEILEVRFG